MISQSIISPYLFFGGSCEEALEFYRTAINAEVSMVIRFKDSPEPAPPGMLSAGWETKVMHSSFKVGNTEVMVSDGCGGSDAKGFEGFSLNLSVLDETEAKRAFAALSEGGSVQMPLDKTFWSPCFGMLTDRFGLGWMVIVPPPQQ